MWIFLKHFSFLNKISIRPSCSVFTGVLATFGVQTAKGKNGNGAAPGGISKEDMERLIAAAKETAPAQTIRIEQAPIKISTDDTYKM